MGETNRSPGKLIWSIQSLTKEGVKYVKVTMYGIWLRYSAIFSLHRIAQIYLPHANIYDLNMRHVDAHFLPRCASEEYQWISSGHPTRWANPPWRDSSRDATWSQGCVSTELRRWTFLLFGRLASVSMFEGVCVCGFSWVISQLSCSMNSVDVFVFNDATMIRLWRELGR